jgi:hypothetical protein
MEESCCSSSSSSSYSDQSLSTSSGSYSLDESTNEIQKFLTLNLKLTPRRKLFEEYDKSSNQRRNERLLEHSHAANCSINQANRKLECQTINDLKEFREKNAGDCMSDLNRQRCNRRKEEEENLINRQNLQKSRIFPSEIFRFKPSDEPEEVLNRSRVRHVHFPPDKSLALTFQKFKY